MTNTSDGFVQYQFLSVLEEHLYQVLSLLGEFLFSYQGAALMAAALLLWSGGVVLIKILLSKAGKAGEAAKAGKAEKAEKAEKAGEAGKAGKAGKVSLKPKTSSPACSKLSPQQPIKITNALLPFVFVKQMSALLLKKAAVHINIVSLMVFIGRVFKELLHAVRFLLFKVPVLISILILLFLGVRVSRSLQTLQTIAENRDHIERLELAVEHLERAYQVADITIRDISEGQVQGEVTFYSHSPFSISNPDGQNLTKPELSKLYSGQGRGHYFADHPLDFYDANKTDHNTRAEHAVHTQHITLPGSMLYVEAVVLNFGYSGIRSGKIRNLALPVAVYSDAISPAQGVALEIYSPQGLPWVYLRDKGDLYGINEDDFDAALHFISRCINDHEFARSVGVRSISGAAVAAGLKPGQTRTVYIEQSGGLTIAPKTSLENIWWEGP